MLAAMTAPVAAAGVYAFEAIDETLPFVPLAARRVLDALGRKLSLEGWLSLPIAERWRVVLAGTEGPVRADAVPAVDLAVPTPARIEPVPEPDPASPPSELLAALGGSRPLDPARWRLLRPLDRYALVKCAAKPEKVARAFDEIVQVPRLAHLTSAGEAHMVDVGAKAVTARRAVASACLRTTGAVIDAISAGRIAKGDVLAAARIAGIFAAKRTPELVPLCHPVQTTHVAVEFDADASRGELRVRATADAVDRTGVEMEAMVAATVASLTVYDMIKSADPWASIDAVRLEAKSGGKSGDVTRPPNDRSA
jgi:molybdenum cofactor biosynthesis protein MoaC